MAIIGNVNNTVVKILFLLVTFSNFMHDTDGFQHLVSLKTIKKSGFQILPLEISIRRVTTSTIASLTILLANSQQVHIFPNSAAVAATIDNDASTSNIKPVLSASEVLRSDINPKVDLLKDILFVVKLYPEYIKNSDYDSIRKSLRQEPTIDLRKTCKKLEKYLPAEEVVPFDKAYSNMIDSMNDLDVLALKRLQGENLPSKGQLDEEMNQKALDLSSRFETMLKTIEAI